MIDNTSYSSNYFSFDSYSNPLLFSFQYQLVCKIQLLEKWDFLSNKYQILQHIIEASLILLKLYIMNGKTTCIAFMLFW